MDTDSMIAEVITSQFGRHYYPKQALLFYSKREDAPVQGSGSYVELYDMDTHARPINARPLSESDAETLAKAFLPEATPTMFRCRGLMPTSVLSLRSEADGCVVWYTPAARRPLFFKDELGIPSGQAGMPPMVWKADKNSLSVYALNRSRRPTTKTRLYHLPLYNIYETGGVCMGNVKINFSDSPNLQTFMKRWEDYFFHSYFAHFLGDNKRFKVDVTALWNTLVNTSTPFPLDTLQPTRFTLQSILP